MNVPSRHHHATAIRSARKAVPDDRRLAGMSETFKVLGDPTRLKIVLALGREELCTHDIARVVGHTESAVSHQLRLLRTLRLVRMRKDGKHVFYALDDEHIEDLIRVAARHVAEQHP